MMMMRFLLLWLSRTMATGKGPIGITTIDDERHVLVADSSLNAVMKIDVLRSEVVERMVWPSAESPRKWADLTGVATCPGCPIFVTSTAGSKFWRVDSTLVELPRIQDSPRMIQLTPTVGYIALLDTGIAAFDPLGNATTELIIPKARLDDQSPSGLQLLDDGHLLVTTEQAVFKVNLKKNKTHRLADGIRCSKRMHFRDAMYIGPWLFVMGSADLYVDPSLDFIFYFLTVARSRSCDHSCRDKKF